MYLDIVEIENERRIKEGMREGRQRGREGESEREDMRGKKESNLPYNDLFPKWPQQATVTYLGCLRGGGCNFPLLFLAYEQRARMEV